MLTIPVAFTYASEVFPLFCREAGMSFAVFVNLFGAGKPAQKKSDSPIAALNIDSTGLLTLFVPQAQVNTPKSNGQTQASIQRAWDKNQERLLGAFVGFNVIAFLLIFLLVPETAGASIRKEHGKLNYMSLEELNYIFGVPTAKHIQYQFQHVLPWAVKKVKYRFARLMGKDAKKPYIEKMYYWVAVKDAESSSAEEGTAEKTDGAGEEHREVVSGPDEGSTVDDRPV
jgi:hypothetical protein